jgi:transmembrane sensor
MAFPPENPPSIATSAYDSAAHWCARLHSPDCDASERAEFEQWCLQDPQHVIAWLEVSELHEVARGLGQVGAAPDVAPYRHRGRAPVNARGGRRLGLSLAAAASLALAVGVY